MMRFTLIIANDLEPKTVPRVELEHDDEYVDEPEDWRNAEQEKGLHLPPSTLPITPTERPILKPQSKSNFLSQLFFFFLITKNRT